MTYCVLGSNIGTGLRGSLRPGLPGSRLGLSSRVKQESPSTSAESSDQVQKICSCPRILS